MTFGDPFEDSGMVLALGLLHHPLQGYLAHKKQPPPVGPP